MEAYIFIRECVCDYEDLGICVSVYATRQEAIDEFFAWRREQEQIINDEYDNWVINTEGDWSFEAYEEGFWCRNHARGYVEQHEMVLPRDKNLFS